MHIFTSLKLRNTMPLIALCLYGDLWKSTHLVQFFSHLQNYFQRGSSMRFCSPLSIYHEFVMTISSASLFIKQSVNISPIKSIQLIFPNTLIQNLIQMKIKLNEGSTIFCCLIVVYYTHSIITHIFLFLS